MGAGQCSQTAEQVIIKIKDVLLNSAGIDLAIIDEELDSLSGSIPDPFAGLEKTTYLQEKYFREHFSYIVSLCLSIWSCGAMHIDWMLTQSLQACSFGLCLIEK